MEEAAEVVQAKDKVPGPRMDTAGVARGGKIQAMLGGPPKKTW